MYPINEPELLIGREREAFDENLHLKDESARQLLARVIENLLAWTETLKS